uniref:Ig-like domain-containing protein n=1 Tax=Anabas testudineus TaxID=64144 RepID=A0A3Q1II16_ANATE
MLFCRVSWNLQQMLFLKVWSGGDLTWNPDLSILSALKHSDNGQYRCYFPSQGKTSTVELLVGSVSSPVITEININSSRVVLQCESKGWYPEPELLWLDTEGKILSAGPTETVRGPDDLYTVSSRVTVEKSHSNNIICRVQQSNINQIRDTQIKVKGDFFPPKVIITRVSIILITALVFICGAIFGLWKWRKNRIRGTRTAVGLWLCVTEALVFQILIFGES